jgi:glutamate dehydrogenase/leucine dehydrogenase
LDLGRMLRTEYGSRVPTIAGDAERLATDALFDVPTDILVLAAGEDAIDAERAAALQVSAVVVGSNCGLRPDVEQALHRRGVLVIPDFVAGSGGSGSMEAVFGPRRRPTAHEALDLVAGMMHTMIDHLVDLARTRGASVREVALHLAANAAHPGERPYGCSPYLTALTSA